MQAYHNDPAVKEKYLSRIRAHRIADNLIQGKGWENGKGCAVGCTLENYNHSQYPIELGIPTQLARIEDVIFEGLPKKIAMQWPERFLDAVPVGADLSMVWPKFILWILTETIKNKYIKPETKISTQKIIDLYTQWIGATKPSSEQFMNAREGLPRWYYRHRYYYDAVAAVAAADAAAAADDADAAAAADDAAVAADADATAVAAAAAAVAAAAVAADAADADAADAAAAAAVAAADAAAAADDADAADDAAVAAGADATAVAAAAAAVAAAAAAAVAAAAADADAAAWRRIYYPIFNEARSKFWIRASDKLIELIKEA